MSNGTDPQDPDNPAAPSLPEGLDKFGLEALSSIGITLHYPNLTQMDAAVGQLYGVVLLDEELAQANSEMHLATLFACATYFIFRKQYCDDIQKLLHTLYGSLERERARRAGQPIEGGNTNGSTVH